MEIALIAAISDNLVIGKDKALPWSLPADERFLFSQIRDSWLLTGRRSWESPQGQAMFPGKEKVILLTRQKGFDGKGAHIARSLSEGIALAKRSRARRLCVLGGEAVYSEALSLANTVIITEVHTTVKGDAHFPKMAEGEWEESHREDFEGGGENDLSYSFVFYQRRKAPEET